MQYLQVQLIWKIGTVFTFAGAAMGECASVRGITTPRHFGRSGDKI